MNYQTQVMIAVAIPAAVLLLSTVVAFTVAWWMSRD